MSVIEFFFLEKDSDNGKVGVDLVFKFDIDFWELVLFILLFIIKGLLLYLINGFLRLYMMLLYVFFFVYLMVGCFFLE